MKNIWYHGSDKKIELFNPYAFDLGNSFQKFGWSTFCFKDYEYTKNFTMMRCIQHYHDDIKNADNRDYLHSNRCTWDFVNEKAITTKEGLNFIIKNLVGKKMYIHYIDSSKLKKKGIGNDVTHNEFTFRDKNVVPTKIEEIIFTKEFFVNNLMIVNDVNKYRKKLVEISNNYNRGLLSMFITYDYTLNREEIEKIIVAVAEGKIKVGDDLYKYVKDNNINICKIPLLKRIKKSILGIFNKKLFKNKFIKIMEKYNNELAEKYTGRQIAVFADIHGLLEPAIAVLEDIKKKNINEIYSLGDNIGFGPNPSEVLDLLKKYNVKSINGNSEEYVVIGCQPFCSYLKDKRIDECMWTESQLSSQQIKELKNNKHSYDLIVGGKKIGLCHFCNDVRIDFDDNSTWSYQKSITDGKDNPNKQFYYTNSDSQKNIINERSKRNLPIDAGFVSAKNDPIFGGKKIDYYDEIIQGHVHYKFYVEDDKVKVRTIRALGMGYGDDSINLASYVIIKEKENGYDIEEVLVPFDRESMLNTINNSSMPDKERINKYVSN